MVGPSLGWAKQGRALPFRPDQAMGLGAMGEPAQTPFVGPRWARGSAFGEPFGYPLARDGPR